MKNFYKLLAGKTFIMMNLNIQITKTMKKLIKMKKNLNHLNLIAMNNLIVMIYNKQLLS